MREREADFDCESKGTNCQNEAAIACYSVRVTGGN